MDKCFAHTVGNCSGGLTREHIISKAVADNLVEFEDFRGTGLPKTVGINALTHKYLCAYHNSSLSPYDSEMGKFRGFITEMDKVAQIFRGAPGNFRWSAKKYNLNGFAIERWFLKTIVNLLHHYNEKQIIPKTEWILPYLYERKLFAKPFGLSVVGQIGYNFSTSHRIRYTFQFKEFERQNTLTGAYFIYGGYIFYFLLPYSIEVERNNAVQLHDDSNETKEFVSIWHLCKAQMTYPYKEKQVPFQTIQFHWDEEKSIAEGVQHCA